MKHFRDIFVFHNTFHNEVNYYYAEECVDFLERYSIKFIMKDGYISMTKNQNDKLYKIFYSKIVKDTIVYIPKDRDLWGSKEQRFIVVENNGGVLTLDRHFDNNRYHKSIWFGHIDIDFQREKKLERILDGE